MVTAVYSGDFRDNYNTIIINGNQVNADVYDFTNRIWSHQNSEYWDEAQGYNDPGELNKYPFRIQNQTIDATILGGTVEGRVSNTINWFCLYKPEQNYPYDCPPTTQSSNGNSASFMLDDWGDAVGTIDGMRIMDVWDAIRTTGNEFHLKNVWVTRANDDAHEFDHPGDAATSRMEGSYTDVFFEDCFVGHSLATNVGSNREAAGDVFTYTRFLLNTKARLRDENGPTYNELQAGAPFKYGANAPSVILNDCVIGVGDVTHDGPQRTERMANKQIGGTGNYFLNLDHLGRDWPSGGGTGGYDDALAALEAKGWTIISDIPTAQAFFDQRRQAFIDAWEGNPSANVPEPFTVLNWKLRNALASPGDWLQVYDVVLPNNNGFAITDIVYRIDGGDWVSSGSTSGFYITSGLSQNEEAGIEIAAVNSEGTAEASDIKYATPTAPNAPFGNTVLLNNGGNTLLLTNGRPARAL